MEDSESVGNEKQDYGQKITINKSTYNKLIVSIISVTIVSAFFGGYVVGEQTAEPREVIVRETVQNAQSPIQTTPDPSVPQIIRNVSLDDDPMKGTPNAPITIVEFSDFQCPFCGRFYSDTLPLIEKNYIDSGKVNFVYRDFPIQSIHPNAVPTALAAECADDQGMFWEMHDVIFENKSTWEKLEGVNFLNEFEQYAIALGLNIEEFSECLESNKHLGEIQNDLNDGRTYGVAGTPGFFVGNDKSGYVKVSGAKPYPVFADIIDRMLAQ